MQKGKDKKDKPAPRMTGKPILIIIPIVAVVAALLFLFVVPHYKISVEGAEKMVVSKEDGVTQIEGRIDVDCDAKIDGDYIKCENASINGEFWSNKKVELTISDNAKSQKIEDKTFSFEGADVKFKEVVIRKDEVMGDIENEYVVTMKNGDKEVLSYHLTVTTKLSEDDLALINSIPGNDEIISALTEIDTVNGTCAVTEENDPNGNLNKTGGYIAAVYFSDERANLEAESYMDYKDICEEGTVAGGQIEVYANKEDAEKRAQYLSAFDGSILSSGDNYIYGTSVVRISNEMTATQMADLKEKVVKALTE